MWFRELAPGKFSITKPSGSLENALFLDYLPSKEANDHDCLGSFAENSKKVLQFHEDTDYI